MALRRNSARVERPLNSVAQREWLPAHKAGRCKRHGGPVGLWFLLALGMASPAWSQQAPDQRPGWLLSAQSVVRVQLVQGRICLSSQEVLPSTQAAAQTADGREENLRIQSTGEGVSIHYTLTDGECELTYDVQHGSDIRIKRRPLRAETGAAVDYRQPSRGPVVLEIHDAKNRQQFRGTSLWHLLLTNPEPTHTHLAPLVEILRPSTRFGLVADDVRRALFQAAQAPAMPGRDEVSRLVGQLNSSEFRQRQSADRALRALGPGVGPHLVALDPRSLSLEQRERIKAILDGLAGPSADTPERIAAWLATDPLVWVELLGDKDLARRQIALAQMVRLTGSVVAFDPTAADPQREQQIAGLRRQYAQP